MNGKDFINNIIEVQEFDYKNMARLEKIYMDEKDKLDSKSNINNFNNHTINNSPFIHISSKPAIYAENQITLSDSQFKEFMQTIEKYLR